MPGAGPEARKTSSRDMVILTGWPDFRDSISASGSRYTTVLPPKPPPISDAVTRNLETSIPTSFAQCPRTTKCPWVVHQRSAWPAPVKLATHECGSM